MRGRPAAARGPRRGLHEPRGLRGAQRAPRRAGPVDVHEPAQLGRGHDPPARPAPDRRAPAVVLGLRRRRHRRADASTATTRRWAGCGEHGFPVNDDIVRLEDEDEVVRQCLAWQDRRGALDFEIDGVVVKVDQIELQRRLGVVGRDPRWAIAWKFPPTTKVTLLREVMWNVGKFGDLHPFAVAGAGPRRRRDGQARDAAQRGGPRPQGHPPRRGGHRPARGRRHPAGALAGAARGRAAGPPAGPAAARALPVLRHADGQARGRGLHEVPEPQLPRAAVAAAQALRLARARWTSTGWARSRSRRCSRAGWCGRPGTSTG